MEAVYKAMKKGGVMSLVAGIIVLATGITTGVLLIINGGSLLKNKKKIIF
ncbi:MAG TPA: hypothetical protein H9887_00860 [Candidatus Dorea intestinavium]|nr:hypothetical protein [Candidatus Dorea intestinavium]